MKFTLHAKHRQPWYRSFQKAKNRCINPNEKKYKNYGGRGIKYDLPFWAMGVLWWRDNAENMKSPTIDRKDNDGDYTFENCRFIERSENSRRARIGKHDSDERKQKLRQMKLGRKTSEETKQKQRDAMLELWKRRKALV